MDADAMTPTRAISLEVAATLHPLTEHRTRAEVALQVAAIALPHVEAAERAAAVAALRKVQAHAKERAEHYRSEFGGYPEAAAHNQGSEIAYEHIEELCEDMADAVEKGAEYA